MIIPKTIHQIWVGDPMPKMFERYQRSWAIHHPGWEIRLWTEPDLGWLANQAMFDHPTDYVPAAGVGQFRADIARYEILHQFGGLYVDVDFEALKPIDPLIESLTCFATWEEQDRWIANGLMGAEPDDPFIGRLIQDLPTSVEARVGQRPSRLSGPQFLTRQWQADPSGMTVLPQRLFYPYSHKDLGKLRSRPPWPDHCYAVHHWANKRRALNRKRAGR